MKSIAIIVPVLIKPPKQSYERTTYFADKRQEHEAGGGEARDKKSAATY